VDHDSIVAGTQALGGTGAGNGSFTGEINHLLQAGPKVASINRLTTSPTEANAVSWMGLNMTLKD